MKEIVVVNGLKGVFRLLHYRAYSYFHVTPSGDHFW